MKTIKIPVDSRLCHLSYVFVNGSLSEGEGQKGLLHLLEHLYFRDDSSSRVKDILNKLESCGCEINAYTCDTHIRFYVTYLPEFSSIAIDCLNKLVSGLNFTNGDVNIEKNVVYRELVDYREDPCSHTDEIFLERVNGEGYVNTIGREKDILESDRDKLMELYDQLFGSSNCYCLVSGSEQYLNSIDDESLQLMGLRSDPSNLIYSGHRPNRPHVHKQPDGLSTCYMRMGFLLKSSELNPRERISMKIASKMIGGGFFSPLFRRIRDQLGYCYSIGSMYQTGMNYDMFSIVGNIDPTHMDSCIREIDEILETYLYDQKLFDFAREMYCNHLKWVMVNPQYSCDMAVSKIVSNLDVDINSSLLYDIEYKDFLYFINKKNIMSPLNFILLCRF